MENGDGASVNELPEIRKRDHIEFSSHHSITVWRRINSMRTCRPAISVSAVDIIDSVTSSPLVWIRRISHFGQTGSSPARFSSYFRENISPHLMHLYRFIFVQQPSSFSHCIFIHTFPRVNPCTMGAPLTCFFAADVNEPLLAHTRRERVAQVQSWGPNAAPHDTRQLHG